MADTIKVTLMPETIEARPGIPVEAVVTIHNTGPTVEEYGIELNGLPPAWYSLPDTRIALFPNDRDEVRITILPVQGAGPGAGAHPFTVTVVSRSNPAERTTVQGVARVTVAAALDAQLRPSRVTGRKARYTVLLHNRGNAAVDVDVDAHDSEEGCDFSFEPAMPRLEPGRKATVSMRVRPLQTRLAGAEHPFDFQVTVAPSLGETRSLHGLFIYKPRFRSWRPFRRFVSLAAVVALLAVAAPIVLPRILNSPPVVNAQPNVSMGNVKLGATNPDTVMAAMGKGATMTNHDSLVTKTQQGGNMNARLRQGQVVALETTSPAVNMPGGVHVGSSVSDLRKAFGASLALVGGSLAGTKSHNGGAGGAAGSNGTAGSGAGGGSGSGGSGSGSGGASAMAANPLAGGAMVLVGKAMMDGQHPQTYFGLDKTGTRVTSIRMGVYPWVTPDHGGPTRVSAITATTTWALAGGPYLVSNALRIPSGVTLTIMPGVHVYFTNTGASLYVDGGTLRAIGTADAPVTFTALDDQEHGAYDTVRRPAPTLASWGGLGITASGGTLVLDHADVYYGASPLLPLKPEVYVNGSANPTVAIENSEISAAKEYGLDAMTAPPSAVIRGNTFEGDRYPLLINGGLSLDDSNVFASTGAAANRHNAIYVRPRTTIAANGATVTWAQRGVPFILQGDETVGPNGTLVLGPGVIVKGHDARSGLTVRDGTLIVAGQPQQAVLFSSYRDDAQGGDSNGDGAASRPHPGDWRGVVIAGTSHASINRLKIWWAGSNGGPALSIGDHASVGISRSEVAEGNGDGISIGSDQPVTITASSIHFNAGYGLNFSAPNARSVTTLSGDRITHNGKGAFGLNDTPLTVPLPAASPTAPAPTPTMSAATPTAGVTPTASAGSTTPLASGTPTPSPSDTATSTPSASSAATPLPGSSGTAAPLSSPSGTAAPLSSPSGTATALPTTVTATPATAATPSASPSSSPGGTAIPTSTATASTP